MGAVTFLHPFPRTFVTLYLELAGCLPHRDFQVQTLEGVPAQQIALISGCLFEVGSRRHPLHT